MFAYEGILDLFDFLLFLWEDKEELEEEEDEEDLYLLLFLDLCFGLGLSFLLCLRDVCLSVDSKC